MALPETAIYNLLTEDATVSGYVGTKVFPVLIPQGTAFPAISYSWQNTQPSQTKDGVSTDDVRTLIIEIYWDEYENIRLLGEAVRTVLDFYGGTKDGVTFDKITFGDEEFNPGVPEYEIFVLVQAYNVRLKR